MKSVLVTAALILAGCSTTHRPPAQDIGSLYIDCTNRVAFERMLDRQLSLTDRNAVDPAERAYYAAIKDRLWTLRSVCK